MPMPMQQGMPLQGMSMPMQADPMMQGVPQHGGGGISALLDALLGSGQPLPPELMAMLGIDPMSMMGVGMPQGMPQGMPMEADPLQEAFARMMQQRQMQQPQGMPQQGMPMQGGM